MQKEQYKHDAPYLPEFEELAGPKGLALVAAYPNGSTTRGWGSEKFMQNYKKGTFRTGPVLHNYRKGKSNFAIVMRSVQLVCIDIDGKNGGIEHAAQLLGNVPKTLAETSKSGNGFHLFFKYEDEWDKELGFNLYPDSISIVQGVDVRATGCVYHHPQQRWNDEEIAPLPKWIADRLLKKIQLRRAQAKAAAAIPELDPEEILMQQDALIEQLKAPIDAGKRNNTLFAIGTQLKLANVPNWEGLVADRADELGLPWEEAQKLVNNIATYGREEVL